MISYRNPFYCVLPALAVLLLLTQGSAHGQTTDQVYGDDYLHAFEDYLTATDGDSSATRDALAAFTDLHEQHPDDPVAMVLKGSSQTLRGRDAWMPWNQLSHTEDGLDTMAQALNLLTDGHHDIWFADMPVSLMVPLYAGINYVQVPDMFSRFEQGYDLLQQASDHPGLADTPPEARAALYFYLAQAARAVDDHPIAEQALTDLFALEVDDEFTRQAREELVHDNSVED